MARFVLLLIAFFAAALPAAALATPITHTAAPAALPTTRVFGSEFVPVTFETADLDRKWESATAGELQPQTIAWAKQLESRPLIERIGVINLFVNRQIRYVKDKTDDWKPAATTLKDGFGDCEDYALLKMALLEAAGISRNDLMMTIGRHIELKADHALLIVRAEGKLLALDNNFSAMLDGARPGIYMPVLTYTASGRSWSHTDVPGHTVIATATNGQR